MPPHNHAWEPWVIIVPFGVLGFLFPGARCTACNDVEACGKEKEPAENEFYGRFGIHFDVFLRDRRELIRELEHESKLKATRIARPEDYLHLKPQ